MVLHHYINYDNNNSVVESIYLESIFLFYKVFDITNEIVYGEFKNNGCIDTMTETKNLCKVIRNHLSNDDLRMVLQKPTILKEKTIENYTEDDTFEPIVRIPEIQQETDDNEEDDIPHLKEIDSGNVSPESIQISTFRDESTLSNDTPVIVYTPDTFLREQQGNESADFE